MIVIRGSRRAAAALFVVGATVWASPLVEAHAQTSGRAVSVARDYPEGSAIPRSLTEEEAAYLRDHPEPPVWPAAIAPTGPVRCPAEYEPMQGMLIAWEGSAQWCAILAKMAFNITTVGDADVHVMCDNGTDRSDAQSKISAAGADMSRVRFYIVNTDTIWIRDYGPRYIYEGNCRAIVDHVYNRPRPNDDQQPFFWADAWNQAIYSIPLTHGGGNFHLDALGNSFVTRLVDNENRDKTEQQIHDLWQQFQNVDTTFFDPYNSNIDSTQHIDMWMQAAADDVMIISDWPFNSGSQQDQIADGAAALLTSRGYRVFRTPARSLNGVHYTYTNAVMCNNLVMIPTYTNSQMLTHNQEALDAWSAALPDKTIVQINSQDIVSAAGVLHCIVMHMPKPIGGKNPTVYLKNLRGGEQLTPGDTVDINWISDDDEAVTGVDVLLSVDGGANFDTVIASMTAPDGVFTWTVPTINTSQGRLRLVVHDGDGRAGDDESDSDLLIADCSNQGACPCGGGEAIRKAACGSRTSGDVLKIVLVGGLPGDVFHVSTLDGHSADGVVDERGKGKAKFSGVSPGSGSVSATWNCGAEATAGYECP